MRFTNTQLRNRLRLLRELEVTDIKLTLRHDELYDEYYNLVEPTTDEEVLEAMAQVHADTGGHIKLEDIREQLGDRKFNYAYSNWLLKIECGGWLPEEEEYISYAKFVPKGDRPVWSLIEPDKWFNSAKLMDVILKLLKEDNDAAQQAKIIRADKILDRAKTEIPNYTDDEAKEDLLRLKARGKIELRRTFIQFAEKYNVGLLNIKGINYGFIRILVD